MVGVEEHCSYHGNKTEVCAKELNLLFPWWTPEQNLSLKLVIVLKTKGKNSQAPK